MSPQLIPFLWTLGKEVSLSGPMNRERMEIYRLAQKANAIWNAKLSPSSSYRTAANFGEYNHSNAKALLSDVWSLRNVSRDIFWGIYHTFLSSQLEQSKVRKLYLQCANKWPEPNRIINGY